MNARDLLIHHKRRLEQVIAENAFDCTTNMAKRYLRGVNADLAKSMLDGPFGTAGKWGKNGYGPAIDRLCAEAEFHKNRWSQPVEEGFTVSATRERVGA